MATKLFFYRMSCMKTQDGIRDSDRNFVARQTNLDGLKIHHEQYHVSNVSLARFFHA